MIKKSPKLVLLYFLFIYQFLAAQVAPVANNDNATAIINTPLNEVSPGLLGNDIDADNDELTITEFLINGSTFTAGETANFAEGSILIAEDGSYNFKPNTNFLGAVSQINYTITDGTFTSNANLNISVVLPPEPPIARNDYDTADINITLNVDAPGVFINDTDVNTEDDLVVTEFIINGITYVYNVSKK